MRSAPIVLAVALVIASALPASATGSRPRLSLHPRIVRAGHDVRVTGNADGCPRRDQVFILSRAFTGRVFAGVGGAVARVRAAGFFSAVAHVRARAHGTYRVTARCGGGNLGVAPRLKVL